jgi:hypothetical protein
MIRHCLLLSLEKQGYDPSHSEFKELWKTLYMATCFSVRKDISKEKIEEQRLFSIINSNMNFLQIKP